MISDMYMCGAGVNGAMFFFYLCFAFEIQTLNRPNFMPLEIIILDEKGKSTIALNSGSWYIQLINDAIQSVGPDAAY